MDILGPLLAIFFAAFFFVPLFLKRVRAEQFQQNASLLLTILLPLGIILFLVLAIGGAAWEWFSH